MSQQPADGGELVFGLVGAVGSALHDVYEELEKALADVAYTSEYINVIELLKVFPEYGSVFEPTDKYKSYEAKMTAGNDFRQRVELGEAIALLAATEIRSRRAAYNRERSLPASKPRPRHAYILSSLKRPEEVAALREIYGASFHLIAAYAPTKTRLDSLAEKIRATQLLEDDDPNGLAQKLINRDLREKEERWGQDVGDTFPLADLFIDARVPKEIARPIKRFVEILFGNDFHTPTREEFGMYHAAGAALRSADLSRQVGASICSKTGQVLALGANDAPRAGGGVCWEGDAGRDLERTVDESNLARRRMFFDTINLLERKKYLDEQAANRLKTPEAYEAIKGGRLMWITEYGRSVHAEMAAISDAARTGIAIQNSVLFTTTFPCHNCAKHIVSAGVDRVVYIEPYPKSLVQELYHDSIVVDPSENTSGRVSFEPFVGIAPSRYRELFTMRKRKRDDGTVLQWKKFAETVALRMEMPPLLYLTNEKDRVNDFEKLRKSANLFMVGEREEER